MNLAATTPITYVNSATPLTWEQGLLQKVDHYFYLGGKKAYVINITPDHEEIVLSEGQSSTITNFAKRISYCTLVIPWAMSLIQKGLRSRHTFTLIDPKAKLEEGLFIPQEVLRRLENNEFNKVTYLQNYDRNVVFQFNGFKRLIIKTSSANAIEERYENMVCGKAVCLAHRLNNLFIPPAKQVTTSDGRKYIIEEAVKFNNAEGAQEELYLSQDSNERKETIRQFAIFIAFTKYCDVIFRNTPFIKESTDIKPYRVALFDLEHMTDALKGFVGDSNGSIGLLNCVAKEQVEVVVNVARQYGIHIGKSRIKERLETLEVMENLRKFHSSHNVVTGKEPLNINLNELGLDLNEQITCETFSRGTITVSLEDFAKAVINRIQTSIQNSSNDASVSGKRHVSLNFADGKNSMNEWALLGIITPQPGTKKIPWLQRVLEALHKKEHIFSYSDPNHLTHVQA